MKKKWVRFNKGQRTNFPILQKAYLRILFLGGDLTKTKKYITSRFQIAIIIGHVLNKKNDQLLSFLRYNC